jgi:phasin family protein
MADKKAKAGAAKALKAKTPKQPKLEAPVELKALPKPGKAASHIETQSKGTSIMNKQINDTIEMNREAGKVAAEKFQAAFGDVNERAKTAMEKSGRLMEEMTDLGRGNVEALVASSKIAARGVETLSQDVAEFGRRSFEEASANLKSFAEVKSPTDFFRMQSEFARAQFDAMIAESSKMSEAMIKLAGEVAEPITNRYTVAAERVKTIAL